MSRSRFVDLRGGEKLTLGQHQSPLTQRNRRKKRAFKGENQKRGSRRGRGVNRHTKILPRQRGMCGPRDLATLTRAPKAGMEENQLFLSVRGGGGCVEKSLKDLVENPKVKKMRR